jgi:ribosomal protein S4E
MTVLTRSDLDLEEGDTATFTSTSGDTTTGTVVSTHTTESSDSYTIELENGNEKRVSATETEVVLISNTYQYITDVEVQN